MLLVGQDTSTGGYPMPTVQANYPHLNIPNTFGHLTGLIWRARLGHRFKSALQSLLVLVSERRGQFQGDKAIVTYPARYIGDLLGVARNTAARTIGELEMMGLVTRTVVRQHRRSGAIVTTIIHFERIAALPRVDANWRRSGKPTCPKMDGGGVPFLDRKEGYKNKEDPPKPPKPQKTRLRVQQSADALSTLRAGGRENFFKEPELEILPDELLKYDQAIESEISKAKKSAALMEAISEAVESRDSPTQKNEPSNGTSAPSKPAQSDLSPLRVEEDESGQPIAFLPVEASTRRSNSTQAKTKKANNQVRASACRRAAALLAIASAHRASASKLSNPAFQPHYPQFASSQEGVINGETEGFEPQWRKRHTNTTSLEDGKPTTPHQDPPEKSAGTFRRSP